MTKQLLSLFFIAASLLSRAQQWIDKDYTYDSILNIKYGVSTNFVGGNDTLHLDVYLPKCDQANQIARRPLLVWVHGGAFLAGDKSDASITNLCKQFAKRGYVTASIDYRLGFISDNVAWTCNYPNYNCVFGTDSAEWYRSYYRSVQDGKGALRFLINRNATYRIDTNNVFVAGESAGAFVALGIGLLDTLTEKPIQAGAIAAAPLPVSSALTCQYNVGKPFPNSNVPRPDLGSIDGSIEPTTVKYTIKGIGNMYGGMLTNLLKLKPLNKTKPVIFSYHQPCDLVVPIDSGKVYAGLSWCMTNGYNCYAIANTPRVYGSRTFSNWNTNNNHGYTIHNEFTSTNFPFNFLFGTGSCVDQANNPCHAYDNALTRETNLAAYFAPLITTSPLCKNTPVGINSFAKSETSNFRVYPQPASHFVNLENKTNTLGTLSIYSALGQLMESPRMLQNSKTLINTETWSNGVYFFRLQNEKGEVQVLKVVIGD